MSRAKRRIGLVITLIVISLVGLLVVQGMMLKNAWNEKDQAFRRNVMMVMASVNQKLEARETARSALASLPPATMPSSPFHQMIAWQQSLEDSALAGAAGLRDSAIPFHVTNGIVHYRVPRKERVTIQAFDSTLGANRILVDTIRDPGDYECKVGDSGVTQSIIINYRSDHRSGPSGDSMFFRFEADSSSMVFQVSNGRQQRSSYQSVMAGNKQQMVNRMINQLFLVEMEPIANRLSGPLLDSVISSTLRETGLDVAYAYAVIDPRDSLTLVRPTSYTPQIRRSEFRTRLFPHDVFAPPSELALFFPDRTTYLWTQIGPLLGATSLFMIIIASCFAYSIRTIVRQRQFASRTTDFINNMTHEFKTPISTISLATEALVKSTKPLADDSVQRFGRMIQEENKRMSGQVEKILQMATLEEGDYELNATLVDMHDLIRKAADAVTLRVQGRGGTLSTQLMAERSTISGDPLHLANIIYNLLDNALKYTTETPQISIETKNEGNELWVSIADNGIGIDEKDRRLVFEKYYRVPTGNVHNVKGFGIGLSYVKLMVEAHQGKITLDSEVGKGTIVTIAVPVASAGRD